MEDNLSEELPAGGFSNDDTFDDAMEELDLD